MFNRIWRAIKVLLGMDTLGFKEAEGIYDRAEGKFGPEAARAINFGAVETARALGHRVTIKAKAEKEKKEMLRWSREVILAADAVAAKNNKKEQELLKKVSGLRAETTLKEIEVAKAAVRAQCRAQKIQDVQKAFTF